MVLIAGLHKTSLIDYPSKIAATVFLSTCNFRCSFCHNPSLFERGEVLSEDDVLLTLQKRHGFIDGVCVTGGEPTLQSGLSAFLAKIKALPLLVKLDTNGSQPDVLRHLLDQKLLDYVAMDFKTTIDDYPSLTKSADQNICTKILTSIELLIAADIPVEFRTTVVPSVHTTEKILSMAKFLQDKLATKEKESPVSVTQPHQAVTAKNTPQKEGTSWYLQQFIPEHAFDQSLAKTSPLTVQELQNLTQQANVFVKTVLRI